MVENGNIWICNGAFNPDNPDGKGWDECLTGGGALNLPYREAAKIQDDFGEWIVKKLKQEI